MKTIPVFHILYLPIAIHFDRNTHILVNILSLVLTFSVVDENVHIRLYPVNLFVQSRTFKDYILIMKGQPLAIFVSGWMKHWIQCTLNGNEWQRMFLRFTS